MTTGNAAAATVSVAGVSPAPPIKTDCEELSDTNDERREELEGKSRDKTLVGTDGAGKGTTISSGKVSSGGNSTIYSAHSRQKANERCPATMVDGGDMADRRAGKSGLDCPPAPPYQHPSPACQKSGHAEARILDHVGGGLAAGSSVTFNIDWRPKTGSPSKMPCEDCHKMLCYASDNCKITIHLCDSAGNKKQLDSSHCPANPATYDNLKSDMGEAI